MKAGAECEGGGGREKRIEEWRAGGCKALVQRHDTTRTVERGRAGGSWWTVLLSMSGEAVMWHAEKWSGFSNAS